MVWRVTGATGCVAKPAVLPLQKENRYAQQILLVLSQPEQQKILSPA